MSKNFCGDCDFNRNGLCIVHRWDVSKESPSCSVYRKTYPGTVFQKITTSPEVLAPKFVYHIDYGEAGGGYVSTIVKGLWHTEAEAIDATAAKLKEVAK